MQSGPGVDDRGVCFGEMLLVGNLKAGLVANTLQLEMGEGG